MECRECGAALPSEARFCLRCGARVEAAPDAATDPLRDALERAIGFQYRIERLLGRGGMGAVYLAHEFALDRDVAIKVLSPEQAGAPLVRERFRREARTAARLNHPNIVPLHTFGEVEGLMYFVMGYVAGESLGSRLGRDGPMSSDAARQLLADLAAALEYAHRHGIVHRDLKPDNILIDAETGAPLLTDFGIAKAPLAGGELTSTGQIFGTAYYMSPEQALGRPDVDGRSDLYSLGIVAYEMISGRRPFEGATALDALTQRLTQDPRPLRAVAPDAADDLVLAITRCLQRDPGNRWPDVKSLRAAIAPADEESDDVLAVRSLRIFTTLAALTVIAAGYIAAFNGFDSRATRMALANAVTLLIGVAIAMIVLKRQKLDARPILQIAFRQPRWWRFWYPKPFRRPGDVWARLPVRIRRLRMLLTMNFVLVLGIFLPIQFGTLFTGRRSNVTAILPLVVMAFMAFVFVKRSRTTKYVAERLALAPVEASKILSTPSWRTSVWQRSPASALLEPNSRFSPPRPQPDAAVTSVDATQVDRGDAVTRM